MGSLCFSWVLVSGCFQKASSPVSRSPNVHGNAEELGRERVQPKRRVQLPNSSLSLPFQCRICCGGWLHEVGRKGWLVDNPCTLAIYGQSILKMSSLEGQSLGCWLEACSALDVGIVLVSSFLSRPHMSCPVERLELFRSEGIIE